MKKTKKELKAEFRTLFNKEIAPKLASYEADRKKAFLPSLGWRMMVYSMLALFLLPFVGFRMLMVPAIVVLFTGAFLVFTNKNKRIIMDYDSEIKEKHMKSFLSIFGDFAWSKFLPQEFLSLRSFVNNLNIFPPRVTFGFDDVIKGVFDGVNIDIIETKIGGLELSVLPFILPKIFLTEFIIITVSMTCLSLQLILPGILLILLVFVAPPIIVLQQLLSSQRCVIIKCKMNKRFRTNTFFIETLKSNRSLLLKNRAGFEKVILEDVNFNKQYTTYAKNQVEARYLLTTAFIERFQNIKTAFKGKFMRAEFRDEELVILIGVDKDLFSMGTFSQQTTYATFLEMFEELYSVLDLVDELKLNEHTGL